MDKLITVIAAAGSVAVASVALPAKVNAGTVLDRVLAPKTVKVVVWTNWGKCHS